jgi:hypothetical protein
MGDKEKRKSKKYRQLIAMVAKSSGYHQYEVEDVLDHFVGNIQVLLAENMPVRISGIGILRVKKMRIRGVPDGKGGLSWYDAYRLSVVSDTRIQNYLKENYNDPEPEFTDDT